jgi:hypothetical protein
VIGFSPDELVADERVGVGYSVQAGFLSGRPTRGGNVTMKFKFGTAGKLSLVSIPPLQ